MANTTYQSPVINTAAKRSAVYDAAAVLLQHVGPQTGGYTLDLVSMDFGVTVAQRLTVTLSNPLPSQAALDKYNLTLVP